MERQCAWRLRFAAALCLLLGGCATPGSSEDSGLRALWLPASQEEWRKAALHPSFKLTRSDKTSREIPGAVIGRVLRAKDRLEAAGGARAELALAETLAPNAFAFNYQGRRIVAFTLPWLDRFGGDEDAIAAVLGHELAHLSLNHSAIERRKREQSAQQAGYVAGILLGLVGVPFGGTIAGNVASGYARSYTRDEERAADELGLRWATKAGYDPCGMQRVMRSLQAMDGSLSLPWLSTHPGHEERAQTATEAAVAAGRACP
jgi:Zn-dependent protease with chaperone function